MSMPKRPHIAALAGPAAHRVRQEGARSGGFSVAGAPPRQRDSTRRRRILRRAAREWKILPCERADAETQFVIMFHQRLVNP